MLVLVSAAFIAAAASQAPETAEAPPVEVKEKIICRRENVIGSRVQKRRVCMSERELLRLQQGTRDGVDDYIRKSTAGASPGS